MTRNEAFDDHGGAQPAGDPTSVDLAAVHQDEAFLDAISAGRGVPLDDPATAELAGLLFAWRTEALAAPMPARPSLADVEHAIAAEAALTRRRAATRNLRLVSGAAGVLALAGAGLMVLSENSEPGDPLWEVKKVVFASEASQTQARVDVQNSLEEAEEAISNNDIPRAEELLARAEHDLEPVNDEGIRERMEQWIRRLREDAGDADDQRPAQKSESQAPDATTLPSDVTGREPSSSVTVQVPSESAGETPSSEPSEPSSSSSQPSESSSAPSSSTAASSSTSPVSTASHSDESPIPVT